MAKILNISSDYKQKFNLKLESGGSGTISFIYEPQFSSWFIKNVFYTNGTRTFNQNLYSTMVISPNILYPFNNIIPFGLTILTKEQNDNINPIFLDDFSTGRVQAIIVEGEERDLINQNYLLKNE